MRRRLTPLGLLIFWLVLTGAAYFMGSGTASAILPVCKDCTCKNVYVWKQKSDTYGRGMVDANGAVVLYGFTGICVTNCPGTTVLTSYGNLDVRKYTDPFVDCTLNPPVPGGVVCQKELQEANGTLTEEVINSITYSVCSYP